AALPARPRRRRGDPRAEAPAAEAARRGAERDPRADRGLARTVVHVAPLRPARLRPAAARRARASDRRRGRLGGRRVFPPEAATAREQLAHTTRRILAV